MKIIRPDEKKSEVNILIICLNTLLKNVNFTFKTDIQCVTNLTQSNANLA